jgi:hypothetical protein
MAVPAGSYQTYSAVGEREDLTDIIYDISPLDTPFMTNATRETATMTLYEWQTDSLDAAASNAQIEGDDATTNTASPTSRLGNYTQISTKVPRVTGTLRAVNTAGRADVVKSCWDNGGDPGIIMAGSFNKQIASGFAGIGTQYRDAQPNGGLAPGSVIGAADIYISDFGQHQIVANRFQPAATVYALDMEYWCVAFLRGIETEDLGKTGDSDRRLIITEYTLGSKNEAASGKIYTTTTS